jgi:hypothetical protein
MLKKMLLLIVAALPLVAPTPAWAAFETIELVGLSRGWGYNCDQPLSASYLVAGSPSAVAVNPVDGHCWYGADWVRCCDGHNWYIELTGWVIVSFPPLSERMSWCGPCELPEETPPVYRCEDYLMPRFLGHADADYRRPASLAVNPTDGSVWVAEPGQLLHLNRDGNVIWVGTDYVNPRSVSVNRVDGSCWVANTENHEVLRVSSSGSILWRVGGFNLPTSVSVNPKNGTAWVADNGNAQVVHLDSAGTELWRGGDLVYPVAVAVDRSDGSCWVADKHANVLVHLDSGGAELHRVNMSTPRALAVNPKHGDCWVIAGSQVIHLDPDGSVRATTAGPSGAGQLSVCVADDTVWLSDEEGNRVSHLAPICSPFSDIDCWHWSLDQIVACYDADLVRGYEEKNFADCTIYVYHPEYFVTRDQMAVYIARALAGGDAFVPPGPYQPTFSDVWYSHWAYKYVEHIYAENVAQGYADGSYGPSIPVDRGQMAVYISRSVVDPTGEDGLEGYVPPEQPTFPDVPTSFWSYKHIEYCAENDIVKGYIDGTYHPEFPVTRDQMAVYICRAFELPIS